MDVAAPRAESASETSRGLTFALGGIVGALLVLAVFHGGGSGDETMPTTGVVGIVGVLLVVLVSLRGALPVARIDRYGAATIAAIGALVVWAGLSISWSITGDTSWAWFNRGLVYLAFAIVGLAFGSLRSGSRHLAVILSAVFGAALGWALLGVAIPSLFADGDRVARLREPVGYWNALALLADAGVVLGLWLWDAFPRARVLGALLAYGSIVALLLTQSRAGLLAGIAMVAVSLWLARDRVERGVRVLFVGVPGLAVGAWAFTRTALVDVEIGRDDRVHDGRLFTVFLGLGALAVVVASQFVPVSRLLDERRDSVVRTLRVVVVVVAVAALGGLVVAVGNPASWGTHQLSGGECRNDPGRFGEFCDNNRVAWWGEAIDIARDHPLRGTGAGTFRIARLAVRNDATAAPEPHSVPLQLLADLGVVGLTLLGLLVVGAAVSARRAVGRARGDDRDAVVVLAIVALGYGLHALVDYDADFLAVTGPVLLVVGALIAVGRPTRRLRAGMTAGLVTLSLGAAVVASLLLPSLASRAIDRTYRALDAGHLQAAADSARLARQLDPLALDPIFAQADVADVAGDATRARELLEEAAARQPRNPDAWLRLALYLYLTTDPPDLCGAYKAFNAAYTLDPNSDRWQRGGSFDVAKDAVNHGACE
jgi:O-antigen ligase